MISNTLRKTRGALLAAVCVATLAGWCGTAAALETLDTSGLPRMNGAKEVFANAATTTFTTPGSVSATAAATRALLNAEGWQEYVAPFSTKATTSELDIGTFRKGPLALSVFITVAPALGNATSVSYTAIALANDLPFPIDAADTAYDPTRPHLECNTALSIDESLVFFQKALEQRGWLPWIDGSKQPAGVDVSFRAQNGLTAFFASDTQPALRLKLQRRIDGRVQVELKGVPADMLPRAKQVAQIQETPVRTAPPVNPSPRVAPRAPEADPADAMMQEMQKIVRSAITEATNDAKTKRVKATPKGDDTPLKAMAESPAPIPMPEGAESVEFNGGDENGKLEFDTSASVSAVAEFYRNAMKPLGWREQRSVINRANMVVLDFSKGAQKVSFTIMQMGDHANVSGRGSGLAVAGASSSPARADAANGSADSAAIEPLEAEESGGLPVPTRHTATEGEKTPFRRGLNASVPVNLASVLAFYRSELAKREWEEDTEHAVVKADDATLMFTTPEGQAVLKLGRKDGETSVALSVRNQAAASQAGIAPKAGRSRILVGNANQGGAELTINRQTVKVTAGVGTKGPDGPSLDLAPGTYKFSLKVAGRTVNDEITVGADETWGLLIGPGGALPMHVY